MVFLSLCYGCGVSKSKEEAEKVVARHFSSIATNGYNMAINDYGAQFFQKTSKDDLKNAFAKIQSKLGIYQNYTVISWHLFKTASTARIGTTVVLQCRVSYSLHSDVETFTLFKERTEEDYKIIGHNINSDLINN